MRRHIRDITIVVVDVMCIGGCWTRPTLFMSDDVWRDLEDRRDVPYWYRVRTWDSSFLGWRVGSFECTKPRTWERRKANVDPKGLVLVTSSFVTRSSRESNSQPHSSIASSGQIWGLKSSLFCIVMILSLWVSSDGQVELRVARNLYTCGGNLLKFHHHTSARISSNPP